LGPHISRIEEAFAAKHGRITDPGPRIWETNLAFQKYEAKLKSIEPGIPPKPWVKAVARRRRCRQFPKRDRSRALTDAGTIWHRQTALRWHYLGPFARPH
jgi:hypothetical protein